MAGVDSILSSPLGSFNFKGTIDSLLTALMIGFAIIIFIVLMYFTFSKKKKFLQKAPVINLVWWSDLNGKMEQEREDKAKEVFISGTNLSLFYVQDKKLWLPRFRNATKTNLYYLTKDKAGNIINFTVSSINDKKQAETKEDETDESWAAENTREFIKRNYTDKAIKWWIAYKDVITIGIYIIFLTLSFVVITYFLKDLAKDVGTITAGINEALNKLSQCGGMLSNSGITPAA